MEGSGSSHRRACLGVAGLYSVYLPRSTPPCSKDGASGVPTPLLSPLSQLAPPADFNEEEEEKEEEEE
eukprot:6916217-Pyramimonas_sp.AAC.1